MRAKTTSPKKRKGKRRRRKAAEEGAMEWIQPAEAEEEPEEEPLTPLAQGNPSLAFLLRLPRGRLQ